jgi:GcrA cell cycle regulator
MGLAATARAESPSIVPTLPGAAGPAKPRPAEAWGQPPKKAFEQAEPVKLRCVGVRPRLIALLELAPGDCRYPYGGDKEGEEIAFCGHPRHPGSSYCMPHFRLTRGSGKASQRTAGPVILRLVSGA